MAETDILEKLERYAGDVCLSTPVEIEAAEEIRRLRALKQCQHAWVDAKSTVVSGEICSKCFSIRP